MLITLSSSKTVADVVTALEAAIPANQFGLMQIHNIKATMAKKGVEFDHECLIIELCQPNKAKQILDQNISISTVLPCRISVYEERGKTTLSTVKPTTLIEMFNAPELAGVAQEIEEAMVKIMQEAAAG